jgi:hypothetical protein
MVPDPRELRLDSLGVWLIAWTAVDVIGLVFEYFEDIPKGIAAIKRLRKPDRLFRSI